MANPRLKDDFPTPFTREDVQEFCAAGKTGDLEGLKKMLGKFGTAIINERDSGGDSALTWAAWTGNPDIVKFLLDKSAGIEKPGMQGKTALIWAAQSGKSEVIALLLARGASVDAKDDYGETALSLADRNGQTQAAGQIRLWVETQKHEALLRKQEEEARAATAERLSQLKSKAPKIKLAPPGK